MYRKEGVRCLLVFLFYSSFISSLLSWTWSESHIAQRKIRPSHMTGPNCSAVEKQIAEIIGGGHVAIEGPDLTHRDHIF